MTGKDFEKRVIQESKLNGITCIRVPDHVTFSGHRRKTEFDYCAGVDGLAVFFDCKATGRAFNLKSYVLAKEKVHQYKALVEAAEKGNVSGYLLYFYEEGQYVWAPIDTVSRLIASGAKSITPDTLGTVAQSDKEIFSLRKLTQNDRLQVIRRLCQN